LLVATAPTYYPKTKQEEDIIRWQLQQEFQKIIQNKVCLKQDESLDYGDAAGASAGAGAGIGGIIGGTCCAVKTHHHVINPLSSKSDPQLKI